MDCQYIRQNDIHEKYLLNRLADAEKRAYEKHITECDACRQQLERQREIISGIRNIGRLEMKRAIRTQVEEIKAQQKSHNWQMILKAAAVVFIIALIPAAIYFFRTDSGQPLSELPKAQQWEAENERVTEERLEESQQIAPTPRSAVREPSHSPQMADESAPAERESPVRKRTPSASESAAAGKPAAGETIASEPRSLMDAAEAIPEREIASKSAMDVADSILAEEIPDTELAEMQPPPLLAHIDEHELDQILTSGIKYQYVPTPYQKPAQFETQEMPAFRKLDAPPPLETAPEYRNEQRGVLGEGFPAPQRATFKADHKTILIHYIPSRQPQEMDKDANLPKWFEVRVTYQDSLYLNMIWKVNRELLSYQPSEMEVVMKDRTVLVLLPEEQIYRIELNSDSSRAILLNK